MSSSDDYDEEVPRDPRMSRQPSGRASFGHHPTGVDVIDSTAVSVPFTADYLPLIANPAPFTAVTASLEADPASLAVHHDSAGIVGKLTIVTGTEQTSTQIFDDLPS